MPCHGSLRYTCIGTVTPTEKIEIWACAWPAGQGAQDAAMVEKGYARFVQITISRALGSRRRVCRSGCAAKTDMGTNGMTLDAAAAWD
jgi:hypothetical protein